jgi:hypothetical protein
MLMILVTAFVLVFIVALLITSAALAHKAPWKRTRRAYGCGGGILLPPERADPSGEARSQPPRLTG